ncbi:MAG: hypothetical protein KDC92_03590 [Bacteroidetes bacterium]|nr:hypothetical protein [Bacteroidota bacterium]
MKKSLQLNWIKITRYEFWPTWLFYLPVSVYWLYLGIKCGDLLFFIRVNKGMPFGGAIGANKMLPLNYLPDNAKPKSLLVMSNDNLSKTIHQLEDSGISFPCIVKPNNGERGKGVTVISSRDHLISHFQSFSLPQEMIIQAFATEPLEFGVFFYFDENNRPHIPSVVMKELLTITGDGRNTVAQLIEKNKRAMLSNRSFMANIGQHSQKILDKGEVLNVEPIGNHCRGTKFMNGNHLINQQMAETFAQLALHIPGFRYGRFDLKAQSVDSLYSGNGIKVVEVNGVNAEPAHIYDPNYGLFKAYRDLYKHMHILYRLAKLNNSKEGRMTFIEFIENLRNHLKPIT